MNWQDSTIKEIEKYLANKGISEIDEDLLDSLNRDGRTGVQKLVSRYQTLLYEEKGRIKRWKKMNEYSDSLYEKGYRYVVGVDEAGRGPLAGPVVAAAVILDPENPIYGLDDSKKLTEKKREELYSIIMEEALAVGIGIIDNKTIDKANILQATFNAMREAINKLSIEGDYILVDGNMKIPGLKIQQKAVIDGDANVNSIAAASIVAKVSRDRIICDYHQLYPEYGFDRNKGYGTSEHIRALKKYGPSPIHRYTFSIVNKYYFQRVKNGLELAGSEEELKDLGHIIARFGLFSEENLSILRKTYQERYKRIVNK